MIVAEVALFCALASSRNAARGRTEIPYVSYKESECFQIASGLSLEDELKLDLRDIDGVTNVAIVPAPDGFRVDVEINSLDFSLFEKVSQKELDLHSTNPELKVQFNITLDGNFGESHCSNVAA